AALAVSTAIKFAADRGAPLPLVTFQAEAGSGDRQFVSRPESPLDDRMSVDPRPVTAAQVADDQPAAVPKQAAMALRNGGRVGPRVALIVAAHHDQGAVDRDRSKSVQRHQVGGHGTILRIRGLRLAAMTGMWTAVRPRRPAGDERAWRRREHANRRP